MNTNQIGLPVNEARTLANKLNGLLSQYQIHYQNLRGFHWNISGKSFFELHVKFEEYYTDAQEKIDQIAERILTLGEVPKHTFKDYIELSEIEAVSNVHNGTEAVQKIIEGVGVILMHERPILAITSEVGDEGTADLITSFIAQQEKELWMLNAWLRE